MSLRRSLARAPVASLLLAVAMLAAIATILAFMYLVLVVLLTRLVRLMETRLQRAYAR